MLSTSSSRALAAVWLLGALLLAVGVPPCSSMVCPMGDPAGERTGALEECEEMGGMVEAAGSIGGGAPARSAAAMPGCEPLGADCCRPIGERASSSVRPLPPALAATPGTPAVIAAAALPSPVPEPSESPPRLHGTELYLLISVFLI